MGRAQTVNGGSVVCVSSLISGAVRRKRASAIPTLSDRVPSIKRATIVDRIRDRILYQCLPIRGECCERETSRRVRHSKMDDYSVCSSARRHLAPGTWHLAPPARRKTSFRFLRFHETRNSCLRSDLRRKISDPRDRCVYIVVLVWYQS